MFSLLALAVYPVVSVVVWWGLWLLCGQVIPAEYHPLAWAAFPMAFLFAIASRICPGSQDSWEWKQGLKDASYLSAVAAFLVALGCQACPTGTLGFALLTLVVVWIAGTAQVYKGPSRWSIGAMCYWALVYTIAASLFVPFPLPGTN